MPLEANVTEHLNKVADAAHRCLGQELLINVWFGKGIPNLTTFTLNNYQIISDYCMPSLLECN